MRWLFVAAVSASVGIAFGVPAGAASAAMPLGWAKAQQVAEFTAPDGAQQDGFGAGAALSGNGRVAVVGAPYHHGDAGAAYVFTKTHSGGWRQAAELTPPDGQLSGLFGYAVAVSGRGRVIVVGSVDAGPEIGAAYVFTRSGAGWKWVARLAPTDGAAKDEFSYSLAMSGNGSTILVSSWAHDGGLGAAYVYTRSGKKSWPQTAELTAPDGGGFGQAVALAADGSTAVVGAGNKTAYVFVDSGGTWTQTAELTGGAGAVYFGYAVAVSGDASVIVVGDPGTPPTDYIGAAYVFTRSGGSYRQVDELTASDGADDGFFGVSVAVSRNGSVIAVGAEGRDARTGADYVFTGDSWVQRAELLASDQRSGANFGYPSTLSNDGSTLLVGADDGFNAGPGSAYVFAR